MRMLAPSEPWHGRPRRSWLLDGAVTVAVLLFATPYVLISGRATPAVEAPVALALALPILVRRIWPVPVFVTCYAVAAVAGWSLPQAVWSLAFPVALYTVASRCARRATIVCALVLALGCFAWALRVYHDEGWLSVATLMTAIVAATTAIGLYAGTRRALLAELQERARRLEFERDQQGELAAGAERERIARELHDIVAHHLSVMVALADGAAAQSSNAPERAGTAMRTVSATGRQALADTRRLLGVLRERDTTEAERSPLPGLADLDELVDGVRATGRTVHYEVDGVPPVLDAGTQLALYRLVQEALTNTLKHAGAGAAATVRLAYGPGDVRVTVLDDGCGAAQGAGTGRGLHGMRARVAAVGGEVAIGPEATRGWAVRARFATGHRLVDAP